MSEQTMKFQTFPIADVSTAYLEVFDLMLLDSADCPTRIGEVDGGYGTFHTVTAESDDFAEQMSAARTFGLSERFVAIMTAARDAGIPYLRFDADGGDVDGLGPVEEVKG